MTELNPLAVWLEKVGESKTDFMRRSGMKRRTLYDILGDVKKDYGILTLSRIEEATGGAVTVRKIVDWLNKIRRKK